MRKANADYAMRLAYFSVMPDGTKAQRQANAAHWISAKRYRIIPKIFNLKLDISLELGKAYLDRGDLKNASEILVKALTVLGDETVVKEGKREITDLRHINIRNEYARLLNEQSKYKEAEIVSKTTLNAATERFGAAHFTVQNEMRLLARIMEFEGKFTETESLHRVLIKSVESSLGSESLDIAYYLKPVC